MSIGLKGNADGSGAIQIGGSDAITISTGLNTTFAGTVTSSTGTLYPLVLGTAVASTSGTSIDFTSIPSTTKRVTVMFNGVSTNGTSDFMVQIGDSGGIENTSYISTVISVAGTSGGTAYTTGFGTNSSTAASAYSGQVIISLMDVATNTWTYTSTVTAGSTTLNVGGGAKSLSSTLDRVRITTVGGANTFDAGSINILYE